MAPDTQRDGHVTGVSRRSAGGRPCHTGQVLDDGVTTQPEAPPIPPPSVVGPGPEAVGGPGPALVASASTVIIGEPAPIRLAVAAFLAGGHVLFEDIPGVGKTVLAKALARAIGGSNASSAWSRLNVAPRVTAAIAASTWAGPAKFAMPRSGSCWNTPQLDPGGTFPRSR